MFLPLQISWLIFDKNIAGLNDINLHDLLLLPYTAQQHNFLLVLLLEMCNTDFRGFSSGVFFDQFF